MTRPLIRSVAAGLLAAATLAAGCGEAAHSQQVRREARDRYDRAGAQISYDQARQAFQSGQFDQALANVLAVLAEAGGRAEHVVRMTCFCCDKPAYLAARRALGEVWRARMGRHYPAMSMIFVADLLDNPGKIELEATAVIPG